MLHKQPPGLHYNYRVYNFNNFCRFATKIRYSTFGQFFFATLLSNLVIRSSSNSPQILQKYRNFALTTTFHLLRCLLNAIFYSRFYEELLVTSANLSKNAKALRVFAPDNNGHFKDWKWKEKVFLKPNYRCDVKRWKRCDKLRLDSMRNVSRTEEDNICQFLFPWILCRYGK